MWPPSIQSGPQCVEARLRRATSPKGNSFDGLEVASRKHDEEREKGKSGICRYL